MIVHRIDLTECRAHLSYFGHEAFRESGEGNVTFLQINPLLADQMCATPYQSLEDKNLAAAGGRIVQARGRCVTHIPFWGN